MQMAELRFILFIAGLVFLVVLAAWELRRPRQAASGDPVLRRGTRHEPELGPVPEQGLEGAGAPRLRPMPVPRVDVPALDAIPVESLIGGAVEPADDDRSESPVPSGPPVAAARAEPAVHFESLPEQAPAAPAERPAAQTGGSTGLAAAVAGSEIVVPPAETSSRSIFIDWPAEAERHIVSVRIVPATPERFAGRAVRLAMTACGFVHGPFGIYHLPDESGRAQISAASLSKPGVLDPLTLDFQRLSGLSLFTVLPGTLAPAAALDHLIETARELSQRLGARLQDDQGQPLDADRLEDLRDRMQTLSASGIQAEPAA